MGYRWFHPFTATLPFTFCLLVWFVFPLPFALRLPSHAFFTRLPRSFTRLFATLVGLLPCARSVTGSRYDWAFTVTPFVAAAHLRLISRYRLEHPDFPFRCV